MPGSALDHFEQRLNGYIQESGTAAELLDELDGESFGIIVEGTGFAIRLAAKRGALRLEWAGADSSTAAVRGAPLSLLALLRSDGGQGVRDAGVVLQGDAEVAERFWRMLLLARPDVEEELSRVVGDVLAHEMGNVARRAEVFGRRMLEALSKNTAEYLQEESRQLPPRLEAEAFFRNVERLRDDVERADRRLEGLEKALA